MTGPTPLADPRRGDIEDDASSTKSRSLLSLAGSLLAEISLPRLAIAWLLLLVVPGLALGLAPVVVAVWIDMVSSKLVASLSGLLPLLLLAAVIGLGWLGGRPLYRLVENSFWSLNSLLVQSGYATWRELLRHLAERFLTTQATAASRARLRSATALAAGIIVSALGLAAMAIGWQHAHLFTGAADIGSLQRLAVAGLSNSMVAIGAYVAVAALVWAVADAAMPQPHDLPAFHTAAAADRVWRIAHLSDLHVVAEPYGFRIESGRDGPRGNQKLRRLLEQLELSDAADPIDTILITGDITDAGRSAEWAEFFDAIADHPGLAARMLVLPGNHDLNIVDRANPARLDLPTSPKKRLRQIRTLSAMAALQGGRVHVVDRTAGTIGGSLSDALAPHRAALARFSDIGRPLLHAGLQQVWDDTFPMVLPPAEPDGLGIMLLDSNADTHFSFTNALGLMSAGQVRAIAMVHRQFPRACWVIGLHHHLVEYPRAAKALSERIGTALINGNWLVRRLGPLANRAILMHGHRHIDWLGECAGLLIASAPSPVMEARDDAPSHCYIHRLAIAGDRTLRLLAPECLTVGGATPDR